IRPTSSSTLFPYTTLFRSVDHVGEIFVEQLDDLLRAALLAERREVAQIAKQDRDLERLAAELDLSRHQVRDDRLGHVLAHRRARSEEHTSELQSLAYLVCR